VCPHPTICVFSSYNMCPHTIYVSSYCTCVLILLYMCPHTTKCMSSYYYMCPHTAMCVSSYYYTCVLILLYTCPHTTIYMSSYYYICVHILLHTYAHATTYVCAYTGWGATALEAFFSIFFLNSDTTGGGERQHLRLSAIRHQTCGS
jgi:hypothetical protein